ncbi:MAG: hypothetical protein KJ626_12370 [Verrucomicrobia bacterium]|nr:hypothetical protein [Verrucomicrobiota bacterium]
MESSFQWYLILLVAGLFLIGVEIFIPGGILGFLGGLALVGAVIAGFFAFPPPWDFISAVAIVLLSGACLVLWVKFFPGTRIGKQLTLQKDGSTFKSSGNESKDLVGREGVAVTDLRPAGIASIDGIRIDVVADGAWIEDGSPVRVIAASGNHITVCEVKKKDA